MSSGIPVSNALTGVKYEIRGQLAQRAETLEKRGCEIVSLYIGNPGLFGFLRIESMLEQYD